MVSTGAACVAPPVVFFGAVAEGFLGDPLMQALAERGLLSRQALPSLGADDLAAVLAFASRAPAITCSRRGADLPQRAELPPR
jgi:sugar/nucleoside kinase (ribokinase family)